MNYIDPSGHLAGEEWERLYGKEAWKKYTSTLSDKMLEFLLSDAFEFGNIAGFQFDESETVYLLIGENADGTGVSFMDVNSGNVYSGNETLITLSNATAWGVLERQESNNTDYFAGGYQTISSNKCPTCDNSIIDSSDLKQDWWKNPVASNFISGKNGFVYIETTINPEQYGKSVIEYYAGIGAIVAGCTVGEVFTLGTACGGVLVTGGLVTYDSFETSDSAIVDQTPLIVELSE